MLAYRRKSDILCSRNGIKAGRAAVRPAQGCFKDGGKPLGFCFIQLTWIKMTGVSMSVGINIRHAVKKYDRNTVIRDLSLSIRNGEFFTLLGPSGCGKTTLLRMIAGFNTVDGGDFFFDDRRINDIDPSRRNIGMVFQNYAIFPHMSVRNNVAFGLKNKRLPREQVRRQTDEFLRLVRIDEYADRKPDKLSGGQQQRVALARALVISPDVLLMDEPLSNLDAKLRVEMRAVIRNIQRDVGITTVYVTHDQEEAMAISDRIAVMSGGEIQHTGKPQDIYQRPANLFVATFIGKYNLLNADLKREQDGYTLRFSNGYQVSMDTVDPALAEVGDVIVSVRPEELQLNSAGNGGGISAVVDDSIFLGLNTHYFVTLETGEKAEIIQESQIKSIIAPGSRILLTVKTGKINLFSTKTERSLMMDVVNEAL